MCQYDGPTLFSVFWPSLCALAFERAGNSVILLELPSNIPFPKIRPSASADASRAAEIDRLRSMSVEERIKESLSLSRHFRHLIPASKETTGE